MTSRKYQAIGWVGLMTVAVCLLCLTAWSSPSVQSGPNLPTRHPETPTRQPSGADEEDDVLIGAFIELNVSTSPAGARAAPPGAWSVVQWQDDAGGWHAVEGWQGTIEMPGQKVWWVARKDFGAGPFRWALYASRGGPLLAASHPFYLPSQAHQVASLVVSLSAPPGTAPGQPAPSAASHGSALMPTTGEPPANAWPSIILVLGLVFGGGLLANRAKMRR